jgi:acyl-CoA synthetase (AMP-forming)/AMP-acid ligase II/thioesterase domain-containing protein/aryl carrier-like protein
LLAPSREPLSYLRLHEQTTRIAAQLCSLGIGPDDRVALAHPNGPELAVAFLGIASACACAPLNHSYRQSEYDFYLAHIRAKAIVVAAGDDSPLRPLAVRRGLRLIELRPLDSGEAGAVALSAGKSRKTKAIGPDDTALVLHTSGTTAQPKIVPLTHARLVLSARNVARTLELAPEDRCLNLMPLFHIHALVGTLLSSLSAGASVICAPDFHAPSFHAWLAEFGPTWYSAVPTVHQAVLERVPDAAIDRGSPLRFIRSSSAPLSPGVHEALEETFGVPVIEAYGMTEAAHQVTSNPLPPRARKPGSVGLASHIEVVVRGADGHMLGAGAKGEVVIRGETVFSGYEGNPEANADAFVDGWFRTGDEGSFDEDGYLFLEGRSKEIINRAGEKVSPSEVEAALLAYPDVVQAVSFAVPHARLGEDVGAAVVLRDGSHATERKLQECVAAQLADFKVPSVVAVVRDIPKGPTGKPQRIGLAMRLGIVEVDHPAPLAEYSAPRGRFEDDVARLWASTLGVERVGVEDDFFSLGGDSILGAEMIARVAEQYGRTLPLATLMWAPTLGAFTALLEEGTWDEDSRIVPVQVTGSRSPLFVTHGLYDDVLNIAVLKRTLGADQPLYAVRALADRLDYRSVEEMAGDYFREIQQVQPSGPYLFASMCSGSAIVIELARHAHASGEQVGLAAVIDPRSDVGHRSLGYYPRRTITHARNRRLQWAVDRKLRHWLSRLMPARFPDPELDVDPLGPVMSSIRRRYRLGRLPGTLTVISTMDYETPRSFWEQFADRVAWYEVETPHHTIFQQPHADMLGASLNEVLRDAQATTVNAGAS